MTTAFFIAKRSSLLSSYISNKVSCFFWIIALISTTSLAFGQWGQYSNAYVTPAYAHALYNALSRTLWALAIGWIVIACMVNKAGPVVHFLNWSAWSLLSRLAYTAYLIHPLVILFYLQTSRRSFHATDITMTWFFFGTVCVTYFISALFSIIFESPILSLQREYLKARRNC